MKSEELRGKSESTIITNILQAYFKNYIYDMQEDNIDLQISNKVGTPILWAEAKKTPTDINEMFAQLILTIYKVPRTKLRPPYLAVFDNEKIAFIKYDAISSLYNELESAYFNWKVTSSKKDTPEFKEISSRIKDAIETKIAGKEIKSVKTKKTQTINDLMTALQKSIKQKKEAWWIFMRWILVPCF